MKKSLALFFICFASSASPQVRIISPLPAAILQVRLNRAVFRLLATMPSNVQNFRFKIVSDSAYNSALCFIPGNSIDTVISIPGSRNNFTLYWYADSSGVTDSGRVSGLTPGHIIGIAGQSNAEGNSWEMWQPAIGDIRMLTDDSAWQHAGEPTDHVAGGPWIVMANMLYAQIGDSLPIGIVNVARGGTGLNVDIGAGRWVRNDTNPEDSSVYGDALRRFKSAGGELECLCWIQGESDGSSYLPDPKVYRDTFQKLMGELQSDLQDSFPIYHLQISGFSNPGTWDAFWSQAREALRVLPPSTLVGTAVGWPLRSDNLHFAVPTCWAVGRMFAGAILKKGYGISSSMYPPVMPDTVAYFESVSDPSIKGHSIFSLAWNRDGVPVKLKLLRNVQQFALMKDGQFLDTSMVWSRIDPSDSSKVQIGLRTDTIDVNRSWSIIYVPTPAADSAPLAVVDPVSGDTIFATAFWHLPVSSVPLSVFDRASSTTDFQLTPDPASRSITVDASEFPGPAQVTLLSETGATLWRKSLAADHFDRVTFDLTGYASGCYLLQITNARASAERKFILER